MKNNNILKDIIWLYAVEKKSSIEIAEKFNISPSTVISTLKRHNIRVRTHKESSKLIANSYVYIELPIDEIIELYTVKKWKTEKIAKKYFVHPATILNRLHSKGIKTPKSKGAESILKNIDIDEVVKLYFEDKKKVKDIAKYLGCAESTLRKFLYKNNIHLKRTDFINVEGVIDLYVNQLFSAQEIADIYGVTLPTITSRLKKNGIKLRGKRKKTNETK